jgi:hypothetical protein
MTNRYYVNLRCASRLPVPRGEAGFWANFGYEPKSVDRPGIYLGHDKYALDQIERALAQEPKGQ